MFLLDTDVLSALERPKRRPRAVAWINAQPLTDLFLSAITIGEVENGIEKQRRVDPGFAARLERWLERVLRAYRTRILPVDAPIARRWGRLVQRMGHKGPDLFIAATALEHRLTVATRNVAHFEPTGVAVVNPFEP